MKHKITVFLVSVVITLSSIIFVLSTHIGGWRAFTVMSSSMKPSLSVGSLVLSRAVSPSALRRGDIITFHRPSLGAEYVTHRIERILYTSSIPSFVTKGDSNKTSDNWVVSPGSIVGKTVYSVPRPGYILALLHIKILLFTLILLPSFFILYTETSHVFRLLRNSSSQNSTIQTVIILILVSYVMLFPIQKSYASLSATAKIKHNSFAISQSLQVCDVPPASISLSNTLDSTVHIITLNQTESSVSITINQKN